MSDDLVAIHIEAEPDLLAPRVEVVEKGQWYPEEPPMLYGESQAAYTDRMLGRLNGDGRPYDHKRNRQCSIGFHGECSENHIEERSARNCKCPHHDQ